MKHLAKNSDKISIILLYALLVLIFIGTFTDLNESSNAVRGLAIAIFVLTGIVIRK